MRHLIRCTCAVALLVLVAVGVTWAEDPTEESPCAMCHDEVAAAFAETTHGLAKRATPSCQTCHGDGEAHMEEADPELIGTPVGRDGEIVCRDCHRRGDQHATLASAAAHRTASVFCSDCHTIHGGDAARFPLLTAKTGELCASCHTSQAASFKRPYGHRLDGLSTSCVSCHDPHAGSGTRSLRLDRSGQGPCVSCHAEKRGPFVFPHVTGITGDCLSCHQPHGSVNTRALTRSRVDQLCLECHSPITSGTLGSQPPSSHDMWSPRYRQCTVCHVAIHGSNTSPALLK